MYTTILKQPVAGFFLTVRRRRNSLLGLLAISFAAWSAGFAGIRSTYWAAVAVCLAAFIWSVFAGYRTRQKPIAARAMEMERI